MQRTLLPRAPCALLGAVLALLAGCATPVFKDAPAASATPLEVADAPQRFQDADVVWGGKILDVRNLAETTEVQVVAYPLGRGQRPDPAAPTQGRFLIELPGFVEPLDFPAGRFLSVRGRVEGARTRRIDDREYTYPLLRKDALHLWPPNYPHDNGQVHFGIGIGVGIR